MLLTRRDKRLSSLDPDAARAYIVIAVTLLFMLGLAVLAVQSGAIDTLNATGVLGERS